MSSGQQAQALQRPASPPTTTRPARSGEVSAPDPKNSPNLLPSRRLSLSALLFKPAGNIPHLPLGRARRRGSLALPLCCFIQSAGPSSPQLLLFALRIPSILSRRVALRLQQVASTPRPSHTPLSRAPLHVSACLSTLPPFQSFPPLLRSCSSHPTVSTLQSDRETCSGPGKSVLGRVPIAGHLTPHPPLPTSRPARPEQRWPPNILPRPLHSSHLRTPSHPPSTRHLTPHLHRRDKA
jgi:hypothetical protein